MVEAVRKQTNVGTPGRVETALEQWQAELLDLSKGNRLLYAKPGRAMAQLSHPPTGDLFDGLVNRGRKYAFFRPDESEQEAEAVDDLTMLLEADDDAIEEVETIEIDAPVQRVRLPAPNEIVIPGDATKNEVNLYRLRLKARSSLIEQGTNVLFVTFGCLDWTEPGVSDVRILSPLVLFPVRLERATALDPYTLEPLDENPIFNPALARKLERDFKLRLGLPDLGDADPNLEQILGQISEDIHGHAGWHVQHEAYLGIFSFAKHAMYADLEANAEKFASHPVIRAISGESTGTPEPVVNLPSADVLDHTESPSDVYQVLDADASQQEAIAAVKAGSNLIIQGPPGTGKSQTITNVISESLAQGKTVLFVSEKMAALRVVAKRLAQAGLSEFCLEAHSQEVNKEAIVRSLESALRAGTDGHNVASGDRSLLDLERTRKVRSDLNAYVEALHDGDNPLRLSAFQVHGELAARGSAPVTPFTVDGIDTLTPKRLSELEAVLQRLVHVGDLLLAAERHPWLGCTITNFTPQLQAEARDRLQRLASASNSVQRHDHALCETWGLPEAGTLQGAQWKLDLLAILDDRVEIPEHWLKSATLAPLLSSAGSHQRQMDNCRTQKATLLESYGDGIFSLDLPAIIESLARGGQQFTGAIRGDGPYGERALTRRSKIISNIESAVICLGQVRTLSREVANRLGVLDKTTVAGAQDLHLIAALIVTDPRPQPQWFEAGQLSALRELADEAGTHQATAKSLRTELDAKYQETFFELATNELARDFDEAFAGWTRALKSGYRGAMKRLRRAMKTPGNLTYEDARSDLDAARRLAAAQTWLDERREALVAAFGHHYDGSHTDWQAVEVALETLRSIEGRLPNGSFPTPMIDLLLGLRDGVAGFRSWAGDLERAVQDAIAALDELGETIDYSRLGLSRSDPRHIDTDTIATKLGAWLAELQPLWEAVDSLADHRHAGTPQLDTMLADAREALKVQQIEAGLLAHAEELQSQFGHLFLGLDTHWDIVLDRLGWTGRLLAHFHGHLTESFATIFRAGTPAASADREQLRQSVESVGQLIEEMRPYFRQEHFLPAPAVAPVPTLEEIETWATEKYGAMSLLEEWCDFNQAISVATAAGLDGFVTALKQVRPTRDVWQDAFFRQIYTLWLTWRYDQLPALGQFRRGRHEDAITEFRRLDTRQWQTASHRITHQLRRRRPTATPNMPARSEPAILLHEAGKRRRFRPIRKLFADLPNLLPALKPCMLMSPLAVAQFLGESALTFDVVIFDEASQILPADAVGAIGRGKQLVVVGDRQQLPPTRFFAAGAPLADDDDEDEEVPESILDTCAAAGLPTKPLLWHYRSRHEHLIAFSNRHFYDDRLITFPSPDDGEKAVEFIYVEDGGYARGAGRINRAEARRIVDLAVQHVETSPRESLGIITFSEAQMVAIQTELDARKRARPELESLLREDGPEGFFVKNLENVQGDERDVIFFSVGYGPNEAGKMSMNFGPLNRQGGERRLNVAVTRARIRVKILASFHPHAIDRTRTKAQGVHLLRNYLEFAEQGPKALLGEITSEGGTPDSPFEEAVATALQAHGLRVVSQVGVGGFRIDLGIKDACSDRYLLGIECDGATYHSSKTARDRDRLRQQILEKLGWRIHRVWSTDWIKDPSRETQKILDALAAVKKDESSGDESTNPTAEGLEAQGFGELALSDSAPINLNERRTAMATPRYQEPPSVVHAPQLAQQYTAVSLAGPKQRPAYLDTMKPETFSRLIETCVKVEGPVHQDRVVRVLAAYCSIQRVTWQVRSTVGEAIDRAIQKGLLQRRGDFLWPLGMSQVPLRRADTTIRPIREVLPEELAAAINAYLKHAFALSREDLVTGAARTLGFDRTGSNVSLAIGAALEDMIANGTVVDVGGQVRLAA